MNQASIGTPLPYWRPIALLMLLASAAAPVVAAGPGDPLAPETVLTANGAPITPLLLDIASDADGNLVAAYVGSSSATGPNAVYAQRYTPAGTAIGARIEVDIGKPATPLLESTNVLEPKIASDAEGNFAIAWQRARSSRLLPASATVQTVVRCFSVAGSPLSPPVVLQSRNNANSGGFDKPDVAIDANGKLIVVYADTRGLTAPLTFPSTVVATDFVKAQRLSKTCQKEGRPLVVDSVTKTAATAYLSVYDPIVRTNASGEFLVVWRRDDGGFGELRLRKYDGQGQPEGPAFGIPTTAFGSERDAALADDGSVVVVYEPGEVRGTSVAHPGPDILAVPFFGSGVPVQGTPFKVNQTGDLVGAPTVAIGASGNLVVTWLNAAAAPAPYSTQIRSRRFTLSGAALSVESPIASQPTSFDAFPRVTADRNGKYSVTWRRSTDGSATSYVTRRFIGP